MFRKLLIRFPLRVRKILEMRSSTVPPQYMPEGIVIDPSASVHLPQPTTKKYHAKAALRAVDQVAVFSKVIYMGVSPQI